MKNIAFIITFVCWSATAFAQPLDQYEKFWFMQGGDTLPYRLLLPLDYDSSREYPLVIFLHGRGESGTDNEKQLTHGARLFLADSNRQRYPAIVVFPQCQPNSYWSNVETIADHTRKRSFYFVPGGEPSAAMKLLMPFTENLMRRYRVRKQQVYVMGLSMGGMGTYELVRRKPGVFAAAIAICGGADPTTAKQMTRTKWWIFHGSRDNVVPPHFSDDIARALKRAGAVVRYTVYPDADHNSWDPAFAEPGFLKWLFSQRK